MVLIGSLALILLISVLPQMPGNGFGQRLLIGLLVVLFGALFVTVSSRIVGLIGSSNNPISGMTIATVMGTSLIFLSVGWGGKAYEPLVLVVGGMICIAAANAGATSQDLKSGFIVGATPRNQQIVTLYWSDRFFRGHWYYYKIPRQAYNSDDGAGHSTCYRHPHLSRSQRQHLWQHLSKAYNHRTSIGNLSL